jgi:hypothetical protein
MATEPIRLPALRRSVDCRRGDLYDYSVRCPVCNRWILVRFETGMSEIRAERAACRCFQTYETSGSTVVFLFVPPVQ